MIPIQDMKGSNSFNKLLWPVKNYEKSVRISHNIVQTSKEKPSLIVHCEQLATAARCHWPADHCYNRSIRRAYYSPTWSNGSPKILLLVLLYIEIWTRIIGTWKVIARIVNSLLRISNLEYHAAFKKLRPDLETKWPNVHVTNCCKLKWAARACSALNL